MRAPARHSETAYGPDGADEQYAPGELLPGERIGPLRAGTGGKVILRGIIILIAVGGGWALLGDWATWPDWLRAQIAAVTSSMDRSVPGPVEPRASLVATASPPAGAVPTTKPAALDAPPASLKPPTPPGAEAKSAAPPLTTAALPQAATAYEPPAPPTTGPADPYQVRAEAVGLHPDLSRVLLARLSPTDYRNAGIAIRTAMAETPDSAVYIWPRQRKPELALFKVRFVPGAAPGCRRYVVTVTKDGWVTTALPMEKCGSEARRARRE